MKLYLDNGVVSFDYTDVNTKAELNQKTFQYQRFMRETNCGWEPTDNFQIVRMYYEPYEWASEYGKVKQFESLLRNCYCVAKTYSLIEITPDVKALVQATVMRCKELYEFKKAKEEKQKLENRWKDLCEYGCGFCSKKQRWADDYICGASGDLLEEKNVPAPRGKMLQLFDYTAFPSENCPFNVNKNKESA